MDSRNYDIWFNTKKRLEELSNETTNDSTGLINITQTGEDNPDEDFFEGAKFMAIKILEREARTHNVTIDFEKPYCDDECTKPNCDDKCGKYFCNQCAGFDYDTQLPTYMCKCNCGKGKCDCELDDSDFAPEDIDNSDNLDEFDDSDVTNNEGSSEENLDESRDSDDSDECDCKYKTDSNECDCEQCNCAEDKRKESSFYETYQKYQVWKSEDPRGLVEELSEKIVELRGGRYVPSRQRRVSVSPRADKYGPEGFGPWG